MRTHWIEEMHEQKKREAQLTRQMRQGSEEALATLFTRHRSRLERLICLRLDGRLARRVSTVDVLQETYLRAAKRLQHFSTQANLTAFMWFRLLVQQQLSEIHRRHFQAEKRDVRREASIVESSPCADSDFCVSLSGQLFGNLSTPSETLSRKEAALWLSAILDEMRPLDREIIVLRHFEELTSAEAAVALGIELAAAQKRYVRALRKLRQRINDTDWAAP